MDNTKVSIKKYLYIDGSMHMKRNSSVFAVESLLREAIDIFNKLEMEWRNILSNIIDKIYNHVGTSRKNMIDIVASKYIPM